LGQASEKLKAAVKDDEKRRKRRSSSFIQPHKHCIICRLPIPETNDPQICGKKNCEAGWEKEKRTKKQLRIWLFIFGAIFVFSFVGPLIMSMS